jgi:hypothetical protein
MVKDRYPTVVWFSASRERRLNSTVVARRGNTRRLSLKALLRRRRELSSCDDLSLSLRRKLSSTGQRIWIRESEEYVAPPYTL